MSDLGRFFRLRALPGAEPLENFTTVALAIAIGHDDRPMKEALRAVEWSCHDQEGYPALTPWRVASADIVSITAQTQMTLWPGDGSLGYLDLVLDVRDVHDNESAIWVEVKVDAWESGSQLLNYRKHAANKSPSTTIITLGRVRVSPYVPALKWSDIIDAIALVPNPHYAWLSLRDFLIDEKIVRQPLPSALIDSDPYIDVIVDINRTLRKLWPNSGTGLVWQDGALRNSLRASFEAHRGLVASAGPLVYGLVAAVDRLEWFLLVTAKRNYESVRLDALEMLRDADVGGLPQAWLRHTDRLDVLERRVSSEALARHDDVVRWFDQGLRQLRDAKVLDRYWEGLATKQARAIERQQRGEALDETM